MSFFFRKILIITFLLLSLPFISVAQTGDKICSERGYTIETINGVFTDDAEAKENKDNLKKRLPSSYNGEALFIDYLLNPSHLGGLGDIAMSVVQKAFENEAVGGYDLVEMLKDASAKVQTKKLLLVAHSQGNFYANSFYDTVAGQLGGVPKESIGVYSVANPASRVAGGGQWITSDTDKVIAGVVASVPFKKIMPPNTHIALGAGDDIVGHGFTQAYLKYRSTEIVAGIQASLDKLSSDTVRNESDPCIDPPKLSVAHKIEGVALAVADPVAVGGIKVASATVKTGVIVGTVVAKTSIGAAVAVYDLAKNTAVFAYNTTEAFAKWGSHMEAVAIVWTYHTAVATAVWGYDTSLAVAKFVGNTTIAGASVVYNAVTSAFTSTSIAGNNSASVILATQPVQKPSSASVNNNRPTVVAVPVGQPKTLTVPTTTQPQIVFVFEPKVQSGTNVPKLVFVGSFSNGGGGSPTVAQVLGVQTTAPGAEEVAVTDEPISNAGAGLPAPALSVPQCAQTLATDGCLLATTTVHFEWADIVGVDHYLLNKNGTNATTTDTILDVEIKDFSDYTLEINSVGVNGEVSATSTQKVSVATIPIAINEIAWMGTLASVNDEWFEIKNNTGHTIDLSQWELNAKDNAPHVVLKGTIAPHAYLIFERTDDTAVNDVLAHATTTGALNNSGDQLTLLRNSIIFDQTPAGAWVAGATSTRQTMERYSSRELGTDPENWGTNLGDTRTQQERYDCYFRLDKQNKDTRECFTEGFIKNGTDAGGNIIGGTPGAQNSVSTLINKGQDITSDFTLTADEERYVIPDGGKVYINASSTLTIEPGVTISFYGGQWDEKQILVEGKLDAQGTAENPIIFNSFFPDDQVGGIHFSAGFGTSTMAHVRFENTNGILMTDGSHLDIKDSQFVNNYAGIESDGKNTIVINNTSFDNTEEEPLWVYNGGVVSVASSTITNIIDGAAIAVDEGVVLTVSSTTIDGLYDWSNAGIEAYGSNVSIINSVIRNTRGEGISAHSSNVSIDGLTVSNTIENGIFLYNSTSSIASTIIEGGVGYSGIAAMYGTLSVASSTIRNVLNDGIGLYYASSTILNTVVENGTGTGILIEGGRAEIIDTRVAGFGESGISVVSPIEPVAISGGEITGNAIGVVMDPKGSVIITDMSSVHDNGTSPADNVVVFPYPIP